MSRPGSAQTRPTADTRNAGAPLFAFLLMLSVLPSALAAEPSGSFAERARVVAMGMTFGASESPREALAVLPIWSERVGSIGGGRCEAVAFASPLAAPSGWWGYAQSGPAPPVG